MRRCGHRYSWLLILVVFLVIGRRFKIRRCTLPWRGSFRRLPHFCDFVHSILEVCVVSAEFSKFSIKRVLLCFCWNVILFDEELVVKAKTGLRNSQTLNENKCTCGTPNKSLYLLKNSIYYESHWEISIDIEHLSFFFLHFKKGSSMHLSAQ